MNNRFTKYFLIKFRFYEQYFIMLIIKYVRYLRLEMNLNSLFIN